MEAVSQLAIDLARVIVVKTAKREAIVQQDAMICDIHGCDRRGDALAKALAYGQVEGGVCRKIRIGVRGCGIRISIHEA